MDNKNNKPAALLPVAGLWACTVENAADFSDDAALASALLAGLASLGWDCAGLEVEDAWSVLLPVPAEVDATVQEDQDDGEETPLLVGSVSLLVVCG